jgi:mannose-6-phosphate isomerase-like protein (cupin superfamily)
MIIEKPWGYERIIENNGKYVVKELFMKKGNKCSLQYHEQKKETVYVLSGELLYYEGQEKDKLMTKILSKNDFVTIEPYTIHRMEALEDCLYLESSTCELNDVVRLEDSYGRT